jgi:hypothetical protein
MRVIDEAREPSQQEPEASWGNTPDATRVRQTDVKAPLPIKALKNARATMPSF